MRIASVADVKAKFSSYLKSSAQGPVIVTKNGKPVAVLLSITDEDEIERLLLAYSPKFQSILDLAEQQVRDGQGLGHEDFWRKAESEVA
ncbi:MAG: type II toxin-antitoxin system Phd/YefM family antitoxin [Anaerolineales bacterium]|nr:type II toxin-antitoxin system Phd/YefM family antitoxin [Anaerolineales bacterium]